MAKETVTLAEAKAHLSRLTEKAAQGDIVIITKHGRPVAQVSRVVAARKPIDLKALQSLTRAMPKSRQDSGKLVRRLRDEQRY